MRNEAQRFGVRVMLGFLRHPNPQGIFGLYLMGQVSALVEHLFDIDVTKFQR